MVTDEIVDTRGKKSTNEAADIKWKCSSACKPLTTTETQAILELKQKISECSMREVRKCLDTCDSGCPNGHYNKATATTHNAALTTKCMGHPFVCFLDSGCTSKLRILRAASTHFPVLRRFLGALYRAINSHNLICDMDKALCEGDFHYLMSATGSNDFKSVLSNIIDMSSAQSAPNKSSGFRRPDLELDLLTTYADTIVEYERAVDDYPVIPCMSCEQLYSRKSVSCVRLTDNLDTNVWPLLKTHWENANPDADSSEHLYMCSYCKSRIRNGKMPPRCVLNGLQVVKMPPELYKLDSLSKQFIQRAKAYQVVVRLGTYTAKVPIYNSIKACKGNMFFLPLPMKKTMQTMDSSSSGDKCALPDPELYIIVNGKPTNKQIIWRSLVNVSDVKAAVRKLKETNWLYKLVAWMRWPRKLWWKLSAVLPAPCCRRSLRMMSWVFRITPCVTSTCSR